MLQKATLTIYVKATQRKGLQLPQIIEMSMRNADVATSTVDPKTTTKQRKLYSHLRILECWSLGIINHIMFQEP